MQSGSTQSGSTTYRRAHRKDDGKDGRRLAAAALLGALALTAGPARADLARVGPTNGGNGFPNWYQDSTGRVLDLCLADANDPGALQETACLLTTPAPYDFPDRFPEEAFYHRVVSDPLDMGGGKRAILVLALEAAFANGAPKAGDQIVFTRIRVTAGVPFSGTYTVTHPYGTEKFEDVVAGQGNRDITFTEDIGTAPGDFATALKSRVGPFLQHAGAPGGDALPPVTLNGAQFLGDGATPEAITGSPFNTNWFEICGPFDGPGAPDRCVRQDLFTVTGRVHDLARSPIGSPLKVDRATYSRTQDNTTRIDVAATASAGIGQSQPKLTAGGEGLSPVLMAGPDQLGRFFAQSTLPAGAKIPNSVTVVNSGDSPSSKETAHVVDAVRISDATYDASSQTLSVVATTSDKGSQGGPAPTLALADFPNANRQNGVDPADPAAVRLSASGVSAPPNLARVVSTAGGEATITVSIGALTQTFGPGVPVALDDVATATQGGQPVVIPVLLNDVSPEASPINGAPAILAPGPDAGTATVNPDNTISYTPGANVGPVTFRYTVSNAVGSSNIATVTVDVSAGQGGPTPTANNDPSAGNTLNVQANGTLSIDVLANDNPNGGTLDPSKVTITAPPASGTATVDPATGRISFRAGATAGPVTFSYTVATTSGAVSQPATVTVTVVAPEDLRITQAKCNKGAWDIRGTSTVSDGNTIVIFNTATVPAAPTAAQTLGTSPVTAGAWRLQQKGAACVNTISVVSSLGTKVENFRAQVQ